MRTITSTPGEVVITSVQQLQNYLKIVEMPLDILLILCDSLKQQKHNLGRCCSVHKGAMELLVYMYTILRNKASTGEEASVGI